MEVFSIASRGPRKDADESPASERRSARRLPAAEVPSISGVRLLPDDVAAMFGPAMAARYPRVTELAMSVSHEGVLGKCDDDVEFAFGLDVILDGFDRLRN
jgi:hypothetical protein